LLAAEKLISDMLCNNGTASQLGEKTNRRGFVTWARLHSLAKKPIEEAL
jgi:hypothetical protein